MSSFVPAASQRDLSNLVQTLYGSESCGICEKDGVETFWHSAQSNCAHINCVETIKPSESNLNRFIMDRFKEEVSVKNHNEAHAAAIQAIKSAIGDISLMNYLEQNGIDAVTNLFNTIGIEAARKFAVS